MPSGSRVLLSLFLVLSIAMGASILPVSAQDGTPAASPVSVDPALVAGFATDQGNFARTGQIDIAGPVGNPVLRWQATLPADVLSAPVSSDGMTFVSTTVGPLVAVDLATGDIVWTLDQPEFTFSAPTLVDGILYQGTEGAGLRAIDATSGEVLWTYLWQPDDAGADPLYNASDGSPVVVDGCVYSHGGYYGSVFAVDAVTGAELWKVETDGRVPGNLAYLDGVLYYADEAMFDARHDGSEPGISGLSAVDAATGAPLWKFGFPEGSTTFVTPSVVDGVVVGGASFPDTNLGIWYGIDAATGDEVWHKDAPAMWNQAMGGAHGLFTTVGDAGVWGRDIESGQILWELETVRWAGAAPAIAGEVGYVHDNEGKVIAFDVASGSPIWSFDTLSTQYLPVESKVAVTSDLVLASAGDQLFAIEGDGQQLDAPVAAGTYPDALPLAEGFDIYATLTDTLTMDDQVPETIQGIAVGPDGTVYAVDPVANRIVMFDSEGNFLSAFGELGSGEGQFQFDMDGWRVGDIFIAPDGTIYVADAHNGRVQVFDKGWNFLRAFGDFTIASGIGVDENTGVVYVGDQEEGFVHVFDAEGNNLGDWGRQGADWTDKLASPTGVAVGADGRVYVSEYKLGKVRVYSSEGEPVDVFGGWGSEPGRFSRNWGLSFDSDGNLLVSGYAGGTITVVSSDGMVIGVLDISRTELTGAQFAEAGPDGRIYVSEEVSSEISIYTPGATAPAASPEASPEA